ncbi:type VI secretion system-associated protein TagO [Mesobacterium pallidum]|uniref:type VI secretion system-associated protein TagO n=1 Tax=Mesobacterium pallidum TaxID=2872037 RepID=UPI001EE32D2D
MVAGGFFLSDIQGHGRVDLRVDQHQTRTQSMNVSTDNQALGLWNGGRSIPVIKSMFDSETLAVRLTPHSESPQEFAFNISGLEEAIKPLRQACHW